MTLSAFFALLSIFCTMRSGSAEDDGTSSNRMSGFGFSLSDPLSRLESRFLSPRGFWMIWLLGFCARIWGLAIFCTTCLGSKKSSEASELVLLAELELSSSSPSPGRGVRGFCTDTFRSLSGLVIFCTCSFPPSGVDSFAPCPDFTFLTQSFHSTLAGKASSVTSSASCAL